MRSAGLRAHSPPHPSDLVVEARYGPGSAHSHGHDGCRVPLGVAGTFARGRQASAHRRNAHEQFARLGKTPYELRRLDAKIDGPPTIPLSVLGALRHEMVRLLDAAATRPPLRAICEGSALAARRLPSPFGRGAGGEGGAGGEVKTKKVSEPSSPRL